MNRIVKASIPVLLAGALAAPAFAENPATALVESLCASCHGLDGASATDEYPNIGGQKRAYLVKQLQDFRSKRRENEIMNPLAEPLTDEVIRALADHYSAQSK